MLSLVMLNIIMLCAIMLSVIMLGDIVLSDIMLSAVMLNVRHYFKLDLWREVTLSKQLKYLYLNHKFCRSYMLRLPDAFLLAY